MKEVAEIGVQEEEVVVEAEEDLEVVVVVEAAEVAVTEVVVCDPIET